MKNPLLDFEFLNKLHNFRQREVFARITLLNQDELPIEYIEGRVTAGTINIDGSSALRRTCNLTMVLKDQSEINSFYWTFKSKFKLEVGLKNKIDTDNYPDIIWFPQGIFILTTCNMNQSTNNYVITINGKDKMCKLNGDIGGNLTAGTDFGVLEEVDKDGNITRTELPIKEIIKNLLVAQGGESMENIIINDLDEAGLQLLEYRYDSPMYLFRKISDDTVNNVTLSPNHKVGIKDSSGNIIEVSVSDEANIKYAVLSGLVVDTNEATIIYFKDETGNWDDDTEYQIMKYEYGNVAGYRLTDLTYAGQLMANVGETIVSVLDKIKNMLGHFEYFYNVDGKFVFQKKKKYISTPWGGVENATGQKELDIVADAGALINLTDSQLVTAFTNNPNLLNVKNDFSVWGTYKSISGADLPIHMRYAIDKKPISYCPIRHVKIQIKTGEDDDGKPIWEDYSEGEKKMINYFIDSGKCYWYIGPEYLNEKKNQMERRCYISKSPDSLQRYTYTTPEWDWRELIYQMALDYYKCGTDETFVQDLIAVNPQFAPTGRTGYEQYYADLQGFWKLLYDPTPDPAYTEIKYSSITDINKAYVQKPYRVMTKSELKEIKHQIDNKKEFTYGPNDIYVIADNKIKTKDNNEQTIKVIYPFVKSPHCCLESPKDGKPKTYWYKSGGDMKDSSDSTILNKQALSNIYIQQGDVSSPTYKSVIDIAFQNAIKNAIENNTITLYVKDENQLEYKDVPATIYNRQTMYRWAITDNYGTIPVPTEEQPYLVEESEPFVYLNEIRNPNYDEDTYWNNQVLDSPDQLIFWFDFLDSEGSELFDKYSVKAIGDRTKAINDTNVKSIYYRDVPNIIFYNAATDQNYERKPGYTYIHIASGYNALFSVSSRGKSAKERIDELLQEHAYCTEQTTITTVPLYHLAPDTQILVRDDFSKINGEYIISKVSVPLAYNGTMNLTATKAVSNIL